MIARDVVRKFVLLVVACSFLGTLFFLYLHYSRTGSLPVFPFEPDKLLQIIAGTTVIGLLAFQIDRLLNRLLNWKTNFLLRFLTGFVVNVALAVALILFVGTYYLKANVELVWKLSILFTISILVYEIFYGWFFSYRYYAVTQVEQLRGERWQLELQFESLKSQISPHYLFNCLNTISSLLYKDSHMAEEFIRRMADTFRYVLSNQKQKLVSVREEVEFVKAYYYLLQVRYEHHLRLEVNLPKNLLETRIPPMALQMLVENAVKHNAISKDRPLLVYISAQDNTFINVTCTKTVAIQPLASFRVGLDNIRNRYRFFTDEKMVIKDDDKFTVQLPVVKSKPKETKGQPITDRARIAL
jgi:two-component system LytT family sensor kinase